MTKILIIEDEPDMRYGLEHNFGFEGYEVVSSSTGKAGLELAKSTLPDLILLDIMLPDLSGIEVLKRLRKQENYVPVILVTAKVEEMDKIVGLYSGADDYVTKPFSVKELMARVSAVLRRFKGTEDIEGYAFGDIKLDFENFKANKGKKELDLTHREFEMLKLFIKHSHEIVTRTMLLDRVWGYEGNMVPTTRTVDTHIAKLRKKIEDDTENPKWIITVHKMGYRFMG